MKKRTTRSNSHHQKSLLIAVGFTALIITIPFLLVSLQQPQNTRDLAATTTPDLDTMVKSTISSINQYGWDATNKWYRINWYINNPTQYQNTGHDGQNDLRMYEAMVWYEARHPGDSTFKTQIAAVLPTVQKEWGSTTLAKGWVYFLLLRLAKYSGDTTYWTNTAKNWAASVYQGVSSGGTIVVPHGSIIRDTGAGAPVCADGYRVDQNIEDGLALVEAGKRFNIQAWSQAGGQEVSLIQSQAFNQKYHLFYRIICQGQPWDTKARDGEVGQESEAFLDAGTATSNQAYLTVAQQILDSVISPTTGFVDNVYGGLFFQLDMQLGQLDTAKKVTQQFHILTAFHKANKVLNNRYTTIQQNMVQALGKAWAPLPVAGWLYERNPDWSFYKGTENWVSTEASGIAMEAAQLILEDGGNTPAGTSTPVPAAPPTATPPYATPTFVCTSINSTCATLTPTITPPPATLSVTPIFLQPTSLPSSQPPISIAPSQSIPSSPSTGKNTNNLILQLLDLILQLLQKILKALKF